ncbi:MAG: hypothetical protein SF029_13420 [bacterium]|nr:hypothetical protein [bacterium]
MSSFDTLDWSRDGSRILYVEQDQLIWVEVDNGQTQAVLAGGSALSDPRWWQRPPGANAIATPTPTDTPIATATPTATASNTPTATPTDTPTATDTPTPTATPKATSTTTPTGCLCAQTECAGGCWHLARHADGRRRGRVIPILWSRSRPNKAIT